MTTQTTRYFRCVADCGLWTANNVAIDRHGREMLFGEGEHGMERGLCLECYRKHIAQEQAEAISQAEELTHETPKEGTA